MERQIEFRKAAERKADRMLALDAGLPQYQRDWVCSAYAAALIMGAETVYDVDTACRIAGDDEPGELAVLVATCELLGISIPDDYAG